MFETPIAQGALTNSKNPQSLMYGLYPKYIKAAHGAHVWDTDDVRWLDFICGLGTNFIGYGNDSINRLLIKHLYNGYSHSLPTVHEIAAGEAIKEVVPFVEKVKFLKTGSEACNAAVKIARAYTGRERVLSEYYHGWGDDFVSLTPPASGVPKRGWMATLKGEDQIDDTVAAVIIEAVETDDSEERIEYLKKLRAACDKHGALLIFDEVITGMRYKRMAVANNFGVVPDLIVMGKAIANGMPLACVAGKAPVMDNPNYFVSSTYAGEILSLIACTETIRIVKHEHKFHLPWLWNKGEEFIRKFNENDAGIKIKGYATRGVFTGDLAKLAMYWQEMGRANILFCRSWFFNWHLAEHMDNVLDLSREVLDKIARGEVKLKYPLPTTPFAAKMRE